jgi:hypothetical protein
MELTLAGADEVKPPEAKEMSGGIFSLFTFFYFYF